MFRASEEDLKAVAAADGRWRGQPGGAMEPPLPTELRRGGPPVRDKCVLQ